MLYVFVNKEQDKVYYATYNESRVKEYTRYKKIKLVARYFNDIEIYEVVEDE